MKTYIAANLTAFLAEGKVRHGKGEMHDAVLANWRQLLQTLNCIAGQAAREAALALCTSIITSPTTSTTTAT